MGETIASWRVRITRYRDRLRPHPPPPARETSLVSRPHLAAHSPTGTSTSSPPAWRRSKRHAGSVTVVPPWTSVARASPLVCLRHPSEMIAFFRRVECGCLVGSFFRNSDTASPLAEVFVQLEAVVLQTPCPWSVPPSRRVDTPAETRTVASHHKTVPCTASAPVSVTYARKMATVTLTAPDSGGLSDEKRAVDAGCRRLPHRTARRARQSRKLVEADRGRATLDLQMIPPSAPVARCPPPGHEEMGSCPYGSATTWRVMPEQCSTGAVDGTWSQTVPSIAASLNEAPVPPW